jgi:hypothetical protein
MKPVEGDKDENQDHEMNTPTQDEPGKDDT